MFHLSSTCSLFVLFVDDALFIELVVYGYFIAALLVSSHMVIAAFMHYIDASLLLYSPAVFRKWIWMRLKTCLGTVYDHFLCMTLSGFCSETNLSCGLFTEV